MGLYNDRLGALFIANTELNLGEREVDKLDKLASRIIRRTISNPPYLAAKAAAMALGQESYKKELDYMRSLLAQKRSAFAEVVGHRLPSVENGKGLFLKVFKDGFSPKQMKVLYDSNVYALESSRVNLGGIHLDDIQMVAEGIIKAIKSVMTKLLTRRQFGDPILREVQLRLEPAEIRSQKIQQLISDMYYTLEHKKYALDLLLRK